MIRTVLLVALALGTALAGGVGSFWLLVQHPLPAGMRDGWRSQAADADALYLPSGRLRMFRLTLGAHEGTVLRASEDDRGALLQRACSYRLEGRFPPARFWTLAAEGDGAAGAGDAPALYSGDLLLEPDGRVTIAVGPHPGSGNWLAVSGSGGMVLTLTLFDTVGTATFQGGDMQLPSVRRVECDA